MQAAFEDAKTDNQMNQEAVQNTVNTLTGLATIYPPLSRQISALKDGAIVPLFDALLNGKNRAQAQDMDMVDSIFEDLDGAIRANLNGYKEQTGRKIRYVYGTAFTEADSKSGKILRKQ